MASRKNKLLRLIYCAEKSEGLLYFLDVLYELNIINAEDYFTLHPAIKSIIKNAKEWPLKKITQE